MTKKICFYCGLFILIVCFCALFAKIIAPYPFYEQFPEKALSPPSLSPLAGHGSSGKRSAFPNHLRFKNVYGCWNFYGIDLCRPGLFYGLISGWFGGLTDRILMRFIDIMFSIPTLVLLILVKVLFDSFIVIPHPELKALAGTLVALSLVSWASLARVVRGQVLQVKENLYVEAANSLGAGAFRIVVFHILPNIITPIIILLTFQIPSNILFESMLSFLGLGLQPPFSSWGVLVDEGWRSLSTYPRLIIAPGLMLFLTMLAFNLFGDGFERYF